MFVGLYVFLSYCSVESEGAEHGDWSSADDDYKTTSTAVPICMVGLMSQALQVYTYTRCTDYTSTGTAVAVAAAVVANHDGIRTSRLLCRIVRLRIRRDSCFLEVSKTQT